MTQHPHSNDYNNDRDNSPSNNVLLSTMGIVNDDHDSTIIAQQQQDDDGDDEDAMATTTAALGRYETSFSKLATISRTRGNGIGGAPRRGYGGGVSAAPPLRANNNHGKANDADGENNDRPRLPEFDRLDHDNDFFGMGDEQDDDDDDDVAEDLFLNRDDDDDDVIDDGDTSVKNNDDDNAARDRMEDDAESEEFGNNGGGSNDGNSDVEEAEDDSDVSNVVGEEFEAFRQSAATGGRRRRNQNQHGSRLEEQPRSTNATAKTTMDDKNNIHSPNTADQKENVANFNETTVDTTLAFKTNANENIIYPPPPTKTDLLQLVDHLFANCSNTDTMTVGGINRSIASHYGWEKVDKPRKSIIKERLTLLIMGKVKPGGGGDDEVVSKKKSKTDEETEEEEDENEDDYYYSSKEKEEAKKRKKRRENKRKKMKTKKSVKARNKKDITESEDEGEKGSINATSNHDEDYLSGSENSDVDRASIGGGDVGNDSSSDYEEAQSSRTKSRRKKKSEKNSTRRRRSTTSKSSGKMAKHLRDQHAKARRRQMEEARIRREELGHLADEEEDGDEENVAEDGKGKRKKLLSSEADSKEETGNESKIPKMSEEDRQRALAIAARFDTNRDELRVKRIEDRVGLIDRLRTKRLELISSSLSEDEEDGLTIADLAGKKKEKEEEEEEMEHPKLTSTNVIPNINGTKDKAVDDDETSVSNSSNNDDDDDDNDEEESEDDLEIIAHPNPSSGSRSNMPSANNMQKKTSTVDLLFQHLDNHNNRSVIYKDPQKQVSKPPTNPRMALQNALRAKVLNSGNRWLARELGYKDEADHIRDCKEVEDKKRKQILLAEKEAAIRDREREAAFLRSQMLDEDDFGLVGEIASDDAMKMLGATDLPTEKYDEEEDEEMIMARELEQLEDGADGDEEFGEENDEGSVADRSLQEVIEKEFKSPGETMEDVDNDSDDITTAKLGNDIDTSASSIQSMVITPSCDHEVSDTGACYAHDITSNFANDNDALLAVTDAPNVSRSSRENSHMGEEDAPPDTDQNLHDHIGDINLSNESSDATDKKASSKKPKNSAWKAILLKEKAALAKEKRRQRKNGGLVEAEAEEEEEEEGIVGLEDFGFAVSKKKDDDDEDDGDVDQDDLDHVVDDVSDGEGDEEAGEVARKRLEQAEEKERHKEIIRRMREGYDGRRGGIASGVGGARGTLRFDQLVAADNRVDAKRLGLLNDDELNSDDEQDGNKESTKDDEEEDEAALLDKMLKERFLNREDDVYADENFTDDEGSEDDVVGEHDNVNEDDDDNREQDRLAKYFEKRARRNRILEEFEGDTQFSRSRLIDEDVSMQQDLKTMKTLFCRKRSIESSNLDFKENNGLCKIQKKDDSRDMNDNAPKTSSGLFLSVLATRRGTAGRKRSTTFVSGKETKSSLSRSQSSSSGKSVSLNHVVFVAGDNSQSASQLPGSSGSRVSFLGAVKSRGHSKVSRASKTVAKGSSLWSKVCSKNFR